MRTQQPLVAGHGDHIRAQRGKRYVQNARRLRGVHQQGHAVGLERARKLLHRLHDAGHVAGMADHAQRRARRDRGGQRLRSDQPQAVGRERAHADDSLFFQPLEHAHHGVVLGVGADHLIPLAQRAADGGVESLGTAGEEDDVFGRGRVESLGQQLAAVLDDASAAQRQRMSRTARIAAELLQRARHGAHHHGRFGKRGGGVIQIDHPENLLRGPTHAGRSTHTV